MLVGLSMLRRRNTLVGQRAVRFWLGQFGD